MTENISAYPLTWATVYPRTPQHKRKEADLSDADREKIAFDNWD